MSTMCTPSLQQQFMTARSMEYCRPARHMPPPGMSEDLRVSTSDAARPAGKQFRGLEPQIMAGGAWESGASQAKRLAQQPTNTRDSPTMTADRTRRSFTLTMSHHVAGCPRVPVPRPRVDIPAPRARMVLGKGMPSKPRHAAAEFRAGARLSLTRPVSVLCAMSGSGWLSGRRWTADAPAAAMPSLKRTAALVIHGDPGMAQQAAKARGE